MIFCSKLQTSKEQFKKLPMKIQNINPMTVLSTLTKCTLTIIKTFALDLDTVARNGLDDWKAGGNCNLRTASTNCNIPPSLDSSWSRIESSNDSYYWISAMIMNFDSASHYKRQKMIQHLKLPHCTPQNTRWELIAMRWKCQYDFREKLQKKTHNKKNTFVSIPGWPKTKSNKNVQL